MSSPLPGRILFVLLGVYAYGLMMVVQRFKVVDPVDIYRRIVCVVTLVAFAMMTPHLRAQDQDQRQNNGQTAKPSKSAARPSRPLVNPARGDRRRAVPLTLDAQNPKCLVTMQGYCLGGSIKEQLKKSPVKKYATYGVRDVYKYKDAKGGSTVLYVVNDKIANIIVQFPKNVSKVKNADQSSNRVRMNPNRGLVRGIFATIRRFAIVTGKHHDHQNWGKPNGALRSINEKGKGSYNWDFDQWQFYFELNNKGHMVTEAWVPELDRVEKNAIILKPGTVLTGLWHNKHPVELTINSREEEVLKGNVRFKKRQKGQYQNAVMIAQTKSGKFNLTRFVEDGSEQFFISQKPKGNVKGCYVWQLSIQNKDNPQSYKHDGTLELCL